MKCKMEDQDVDMEEISNVRQRNKRHEDKKVCGTKKQAAHFVILVFLVKKPHCALHTVL